MATFIDGPAAGVTLELKRCPYLLRVVRRIGTGKAGGPDLKGPVEVPVIGWDALDQPEDRPEPAETIYLYKADLSTVGRAHVCRSPRSRSGWITWADYHFVDPQPSEMELRVQAEWEHYCNQHREEFDRAVEALK
jgi:hypothetical protein